MSNSVLQVALSRTSAAIRAVKCIEAAESHHLNFGSLGSLQDILPPMQKLIVDFEDEPLATEKLDASEDGWDHVENSSRKSYT